MKRIALFATNVSPGNQLPEKVFVLFHAKHEYFFLRLFLLVALLNTTSQETPPLPSSILLSASLVRLLPTLFKIERRPGRSGIKAAFDG